MLSLLLDEDISPEVTHQIAQKQPDIQITSVHYWHEGYYKGQPAEAILTAAMREGRSLVTYDQKTILPVLVQWGAAGIAHAGVVFVDDRSISNSDFGAIVKAVTALRNASRTAEWKNRVEFLRPACENVFGITGSA